jgi:hypothetical protein
MREKETELMSTGGERERERESQKIRSGRIFEA